MLADMQTDWSRFALPPGTLGGKDGGVVQEADARAAARRCAARQPRRLQLAHWPAALKALLVLPAVAPAGLAHGERGSSLCRAPCSSEPINAHTRHALAGCMVAKAVSACALNLQPCIHCEKH